MEKCGCSWRSTTQNSKYDHTQSYIWGLWGTWEIFRNNYIFLVRVPVRIWEKISPQTNWGWKDSAPANSWPRNCSTWHLQWKAKATGLAPVSQHHRPYSKEHLLPYKFQYSLYPHKDSMGQFQTMLPFFLVRSYLKKISSNGSLFRNKKTQLGPIESDENHDSWYFGAAT